MLALPATWGMGTLKQLHPPLVAWVLPLPNTTSAAPNAKYRGQLDIEPGKKGEFK
jgi:hypothetical protein